MLLYCWVNRLIIIMKNLGQIKSGQLQKYSTIQPIVRATSFQVIEPSNGILKHPLFKRSNHCQNNYQLANVVKQLLQNKPRTAHKINPKNSLRNHKTETIPQATTNVKFFTSDSRKNDHSIKEFEDNNQQQVGKISSRNKKLSFNFLEIDNRLNSNKTATSKSSRSLKRQHQKPYLQSLNSNTTIQANNEKLTRVDDISKTESNQCKVRITKRATQHQLPKSKLTIKNIDKLIDVQSQKSINKGRNPVKYDLYLPKRAAQFKEDNQTDTRLSKEKRVKKSITEMKIPEFIKASLQIYQQEPIYLIEQLEKRRKRQQQLQKQQQVNIQKVQQMKDIQDIQQKEKTVQQDQNIFANKIKLTQKQKKKHLNNVESIHQISEPAEAQAINVPKKMEKKGIKSKKREYLQQKINICGWEQDDPNLPETLYFKF